MTFNLIVYGGVFSSQTGYTAYRFAQAVAQKHTLSQVFFYQDGVTQANELAAPLSDEFNPTLAWAELAREHEFELVVCISAAEKRGVISAEQQIDLAKSARNLHPAFSVQGLGAMLAASLSADRTITFK